MAWPNCGCRHSEETVVIKV